MDKYFYDVVYEVWRSGGNSDSVDPDYTDDCQEREMEPENCAEHYLRNRREELPDDGGE